MNNKVEKEFSSGGITVTIWNNEEYGANGRFETKTVAITKRYFKNGKWEKTNSLKIGDLPILNQVINKAFDHLSIKST